MDIGQKRDPTAICVSETISRTVEGRTEDHFFIRHLDRLALGTRYPEVSERVSELVDRLRAKTGTTPELFVDATGVGQPVVDLLEERLRDIQPIPVYFTHGDRRTEKMESGRRSVTLGKAWLVSRLQAQFQTTRIHIPRTPESEALSRELLDFEIRVTEDGNDRYGAFRVGTHDDLVTALGLATQNEYPMNAWRFFERVAKWEAS